MRTVILTGGQSRRMGCDKALLPFQGSTMLQSLIDRYRAAFGDVAVSVDVPGRFSFSGAGEVADRYPGLGPLNGIISGFDGTEDDLVFITATDLPFGEAALAERLRDLIGTADACILRRGKKGIEPLFAVYRRSCAATAERCLEEGRKSFFDLFERINVRYVEEAEVAEFDLERILRNVNTQDEYERMLKTDLI